VLRRAAAGGAVRRLAPVLALLVLAPWVGEYLLGNVPASLLPALPFLIPLYGGGAVLVREAARRAGRGWPAILLLATAYGVVEAGLVDKSLFNPGFEALDQTGVTPVLGISAYHASAFVLGHTIWSICVPIALVELWTPAARRTSPWLGRRGLVVIAGLYLLGCWIIFRDLLDRERFLASAGQLLAAVVVAAALIGAAFVVRPRPDRPAAGWVPGPRLLGVLSFVAASAFFARPETWAGVAVGAALVVAAAVAVARWSGRPGWTPHHLLALAAGALLTYAWGGFVLTALYGPDDPVRWAGNAVFALLAVGLVAASARRLRRTEPVEVTG
jgi:hypothetical protein